MIKFDCTIFVQFLNTVLLIGIIYFIFYILIKLPRCIKRNEDRIERIEKLLEEDNQRDK
ncbi:hypothetical protein SAMN02745883_02005 [Caminicella sporogenes DSM 14501]|uniref:DUF4083 domain-containing protein n=1 Tax=Caminicella sporogenes DSM 14501 TaxID=1121266 RepID=A0A1M6SAC3_9FIRM|nr:hypothetical protein [Caminicella sporogenes]SHK41733.1 hypothetical protein SAMN02745883_02005 [Caminicella sporogenes DSM 14501]